jgi:hypothetical protein
MYSTREYTACDGSGGLFFDPTITADKLVPGKILRLEEYNCLFKLCDGKPCKDFLDNTSNVVCEEMLEKIRALVPGTPNGEKLLDSIADALAERLKWQPKKIT